MGKDQIYSELSQIFNNVFDDDDLVVTPNLTANDVDGWDSLSHLRLVLSVEKTFKIKFSAAEVGNMKNVGDMADIISSKI